MTTRKLLALIAVLVLALTACGGDDDGDDGADAGAGEIVGSVSDGAKTFSASCASCHGQDAKGIEGLGKSLVDNEFIASSSEAELADFIAVGRSSSDPDNTTGIDMPPKGGNPSLDDQDMADLAAYLKTLN